ncbi:Alaserpin [Eumeta japonica]|uniref:Alaserpin n=1 Tax=Eumeta variegata TaxID=151549 RepID=A0A4C1U5P3_EUMVA|nr:Alaserpin [Eumeta japonica]
MDLKKFNISVTTFSMKFCNELKRNQNIVSSPLSAEILLALMTLGATDPAHSQLLKALEFPDDDFIRSSFTTVSQKFKAIKGVTLNVANKVYIKEGPYDLVPEIKKDAVDVFDADFEKIDFGHGAAAAALINNWLLEMPYIGDEASMLIILPNEIDGLPNVMQKLANGYDIIGAVEKMYSTKVHVMVPKFKIETTIDMKKLLPKLGINAIFSRSSGLNRILNTSEDIYVSNAIQKAFIEVNEEGAEAAAATGMLTLPTIGLGCLAGGGGCVYLCASYLYSFYKFSKSGEFLRLRESMGSGDHLFSAIKVMKRVLPKVPHFVADRPFLYVLSGAERTPLFVGAFFGPDST